MVGNSQDQYKRNVAYKLRVNDILMGKPILDGDKFNFLELGDKKIVRVNVVGNIVDKYESEGDKQYIFSTLDDGSGQIKLKAFGDDSKQLQDKDQGKTVVVIGVLRYFNDEVYISPEIVREMPAEYLLVRKLETEQSAISGTPANNMQTSQSDTNSQPQNQQPSGEQTSQKPMGVKDKILEIIKQAENDGGIEIDQIIQKPEVKDASPEIINQEIKKLLEEGIIFEPRPGKLRWLG